MYYTPKLASPNSFKSWSSTKPRISSFIPWLCIGTLINKEVINLIPIYSIKVLDMSLLIASGNPYCDTNRILLNCQQWHLLWSLQNFYSQSNFDVHNSLAIDQRFSTWGTRTPRGRLEAHRGYAKFKNLLKRRPYGWNFWFGGTRRVYNSDLGVRRQVKFGFGGTRVPKGWEPLP